MNMRYPNGFSAMIRSGIRLHEATGAERYLDAARQWAEVLDRHYWTEAGGYATSADDTDDVIVRRLADVPPPRS